MRFIAIILLFTIVSCNQEKRLTKKYAKHPDIFCKVAAKHCQADSEVIIRDSIVFRDTVLYRDTTIYITLLPDTVYKTVKIYVNKGVITSDTLRIRLYPSEFVAYVSGDELKGNARYFDRNIEFTLKNAQKLIISAKEYYKTVSEKKTYTIETNKIPSVMWWLLIVLFVISVLSNRKWLLSLLRNLIIKR